MATPRFSRIVIECFRGRHRGGRNFTSFGRFSGPFFRAVNLVAPYCAIPRDYLSDAPLLHAMVFFGVSTWPSGCDTLSPFLSVSPWRAFAKWRVSQKNTCAIPYENKAKCLRYPPLRYYLERVLRNMGGYLALGRFRAAPVRGVCRKSENCSKIS